MRGVPLVILAILILSVPIQIVSAHNEDNKGEGTFDLQASPDKLTVHRGGTVSSIVSLELEQDPAISVQLTLNWDNRIPSDVSYSFKPSSIGNEQSSVLTFKTQLNSTIGNFHFHVWGTFGSETESIRMALKIKQFHPHGEGEPDFTVSADPLYVTASPGSNASSMVIVKSLRGFSAPVDLMLNWESVPSGVSTNLHPSTLTPTGTSNLTLMVGMSAPTGLYGFEIIGTAGSIVHESPGMWLNISTPSNHPPPPQTKDFTLKVTPNSWTINASETVDYNLTLGSVNGFDQQVSLSLTPSTLHGATITFSSKTPTPANPPTLVHLQIQTTKTLKNDTYGFTVTATNGTITHQVSIFLIVLPATKVTPPAVLLTLYLSRYNITLGDTIMASGLLSPHQGLANTPILLVYTSISPVQWKVIDNVLTNTTAGYFAEWTPIQEGTFLVRAIWGGNSTNTGALSNLAILTVMSRSTTIQSAPEFPWFWLAIAAIIIIGVATAVTLRIRKKPIATPVKP